MYSTQNVYNQSALNQYTDKWHMPNAFICLTMWNFWGYLHGCCLSSRGWVEAWRASDCPELKCRLEETVERPVVLLCLSWPHTQAESQPAAPSLSPALHSWPPDPHGILTLAVHRERSFHAAQGTRIVTQQLSKQSSRTSLRSSVLCMLEAGLRPDEVERKHANDTSGPEIAELHTSHHESMGIWQHPEDMIELLTTHHTAGPVCPTGAQKNTLTPTPTTTYTHTHTRTCDHSYILMHIHTQIHR